MHGNLGPQRRIARLAGGIYLVVAILGGFAHLYARSSVYVPGDAAATAANIVEHSALFRYGFMADLVMATCFLLLGLMFYRLFHHVNKDVAAALVVFVAIGTAMILVNLIHHFAALVVATDPSYASAMGPAGSDALVLLLVDLHHYGYQIAGILFGLWLFPLGYLAYTSGMFPRALGIILMIACFCYLTHAVVGFLVPDLPAMVSTVVTAPTAVAELWMVGYLVLIGVRNPKKTRRSRPPAIA